MATRFPAQLDTTTNLPNIVDLSNTAKLTQSIGITDTVLNVNTTSGYPLANGLIVLEQEQIFYSSASGNQFLGCLRAANGTLNGSHTAGTAVQSLVTASAYTNLRDAILQLEATLSLNATNLLNVNPPNLSIAGNLTIGGALSVSGTFNPANLLGTSSATSINSVSFSATPVFNAALGNIQTITLTGNVTSSTLSNAVTGQYLFFLILQDVTGGRTFSWPPNVRGGGNIGSSPNKGNTQAFFWDGAVAWSLTAMLINL
jgi:hypothetical protein